MARGRLLVLDDDPTVGGLLVMVAESVDFEARLCESAAAFFETLPDWLPTHLALDLLMPDLSGLEVLRRLAARACRARIIISSGAGHAELDAALQLAQGLGLPTAGVLAKPFSVAALRALLQEGAGTDGGPGSA